MAESILNVDVKVYTKDGWTVREWPDKWIEAHTHISGSITHYAVIVAGALFGYYITVTFPFAMANNDYYFTQQWQIGNGFTMKGATLGRTLRGSNVYAVATEYGTKPYECWLYLAGYRQ